MAGAQPRSGGRKGRGAGGRRVHHCGHATAGPARPLCRSDSASKASSSPFVHKCNNNELLYRSCVHPLGFTIIGTPLLDPLFCFTAAAYQAPPASPTSAQRCQTRAPASRGGTVCQASQMHLAHMSFWCYKRGQRASSPTNACQRGARAAPLVMSSLPFLSAGRRSPQGPPWTAMSPPTLRSPRGRRMQQR